jgi:DNA polymerase-3 subunit epsilon
MGERLGLRLRFALFFAALAAGGTALMAGGLWLGHARAGGPAEGYVIAGIVAGFGLTGLAAWIGLLFDENVAKPILALSAELETRAQSDVAADIDARPARYLGALAPAAQSIHAALEETRTSLESALAEKMAAMERDKALLEALLRELADGVVVTSADGRILLYNREAAALLGPLGLDRRLSRFLRPDPVTDAVKRLEEGAGGEEREQASFLTATTDGDRILSGAVSNVTLDSDRLGHVLLFRDTTEDLRTHEELERLLRDMIEGVRRPTSAMSAVLDVVGAVPDMPAEDRAGFDASLREELARLSATLDEAAAREGAIGSSHWPIREIAAQQILDALALRISAEVRVVASSAFARCDGFAVTEILSRLAEAVTADPARGALALHADVDGAEIRLVMGWQGPPLPVGELEALLDQPIAPAYGAYTGRDALKAHRSDVWVEPAEAGARIILPLEAAGVQPPRRAPGAMDFYDFNLPAAVDPELENRPLSELSFVVFDTETTGLDPDRDEVVQMSGIRVLGGRLLRGETFDRLVNPGRPIPQGATEIHGIPDSMVAGAPAFPEVAADFAGYSEGSVLVAHHAAFDLAFLTRLKAAGGPAIERPALCTAQLSFRLFSHAEDHTLDGLAERFGIEIPDRLRHTALGDAVATAEVFLKMIPLLEARNIHTLRAALDWQAGASGTGRTSA